MELKTMLVDVRNSYYLMTIATKFNLKFWLFKFNLKNNFVLA